MDFFKCVPHVQCPVHGDLLLPSKQLLYWYVLQCLPLLSSPTAMSVNAARPAASNLSLATLPINNSVCLSVSVSLSVCLSVYLSVCLSVCLSISLSVWLALCLPVGVPGVVLF